MEADIGDEEEELSVTAKTKFIPYSRKLDRKKKVTKVTSVESVLMEKRTEETRCMHVGTVSLIRQLLSIRPPYPLSGPPFPLSRPPLSRPPSPLSRSL